MERKLRHFIGILSLRKMQTDDTEYSVSSVCILRNERIPMKWRSFLSIALVAAAAGLAAASRAQERFDYTVRDAMFRAFGRNDAAFKHAQAIIYEKLREDPDHAEALLLRGAGRSVHARTA